MARPGSPHGYDICDHNRLNPELGDSDDFGALVRALDAHGLLLVLDFVPNHMGIDPLWNAWWREVLQDGPCSPHARFFDIDWDPVVPEMKNKVLLPILGDQYGAVLERGELSLGLEDGELFVQYYEHRLPINPRQQPIVLRHRLDALEAELGADDPHVRELRSILTGLRNLPVYTDTDPDSIDERHREKTILRVRLVRLLERSAAIRAHVARALAAANGVPGRPETFDTLHLLLEQQPYRLAYWRTAQHEINYRRFFDINELAAIRVEDPHVFEATHALLARLLARDQVHGLRIDHPDGLFDPASYFARAQTLAARGPIWMVAEKILSHGEQLPFGWAIHGTTGYNVLNLLNGLFIKPEGLRSLHRLYVRVTGRSLPFAEVAYKSKKLIIETTLASELNVLVHALSRIAQSNRRSRDFTLSSLRDLLTEVVACFPAYRTYISHDGWTGTDQEVIDRAISEARRRNPAMERSLFDFLHAVLLPVGDDDGQAGIQPFAPVDAEDRAHRITFAMKLQQYTGPVQAKGLEDTACYRYNPLISTTEVGGDPARPLRSVDDFHRANLHRLATWPLEMLATSTHDTKLGEDVRARLNVLSEMPDVWRAELARWSRMTAGARVQGESGWAPARNDEYRFYQALAGIWPADLGPEGPAPAPLVERLREYMTKAIREAKLHTSWINPNQAYDDAMAAFVDRVLTGPPSQRFLPAFVPFARRLARAGAVNSLAQTLLKLTSPGVPDVYQGSELWDLSLVDPDNRRPVDYAHRQRLLEAVEPLLPELAGGPARADRPAELAALLDGWCDGRIKLFVTTAALRLRRAHPSLFLDGEYIPLACDVTVSGDLVAFARRLGNRALVAVVPRFVAAAAWEDPQRWPTGAAAWATSRVLLPPDLAARSLRNLLTDDEVAVVRHPREAWFFASDALREFPVALLWGQAPEG